MSNSINLTSTYIYIHTRISYISVNIQNIEGTTSEERERETEDKTKSKYQNWEEILDTRHSTMSDEANKHHHKWSIEVAHTLKSDRGNIRRSSDPFASPKIAHEGCYTLYEALRRGLELNPMGPCLGFRAISSTGFPTPFIFSSYTEVVSRVDSFAAGLDRMQLISTNDTGMKLVSFVVTYCFETSTFCLFQ